MNQLIKVVNFYKNKKTDPDAAINKFLNEIDEKYYIKPTRYIKTDSFNFIFFPKVTNIKNDCPLCFENIYKNNYLKIMPISLTYRFFFIQPSVKQYVKNHLVIIDFTHRKMAIDKETISYFFCFLNQFPKYCICSNCELKGVGGSVLNHLHYQAGIMDMPIFHKDASLIEDEIYLVDWYLTTFLIKHKEKEIITEKYNYLLEKYQNENTSFNPVMFIRGDVYYLYMILRCGEEINHHAEYSDFKKGIGVFEAMGHFILNEQPTPINKLIELSKNILNYKRKESY